MRSAWHLPEVHEPSTEEIEAACAGIRASWSERVRRRRAGRSTQQAVVLVQLTTALGLDRRRASSPNLLEYL
jgi:hypothetical protein